MTRLPVAQTLPPKPASVALSELAVTAGVVGSGITLCFDGFPAPALCQLWRYCIRYAGPDAVYHVRTQADVRKLAKVIDTPPSGPRVHAASLHRDFLGDSDFRRGY